MSATIPVRVKEKILRLPGSMTIERARAFTLLVTEFEDALACGDRQLAESAAAKLIAAGFKHPRPPRQPRPWRKPGQPIGGRRP